MIRRREGAVPAAVLALLLAVGAACAPALHEPPPVAQLATATGAGGAPAAGAPELLARARAAFARRPDVAAVREAELLFVKAAEADPTGIDGLVGAIDAKGWLVQHEKDGDERLKLAESAVQAGQWCERRAPERVECAYGLALGLGMQARERPATANDGLKLMIERLHRAQKSNERLDHGGPHRVLALLLVRAPGWPAGPGDPETALAEARKALALFPDFPPNLLVAAEAARATGADGEARGFAAAALEQASRLAASGDRDAPDWMSEARQLMQSAGWK